MGDSVEVAVACVVSPTLVKTTSPGVPGAHASHRTSADVASTPSDHGPFVIEGASHTRPPPAPPVPVDDEDDVLLELVVSPESPQLTPAVRAHATTARHAPVAEERRDRGMRSMVAPGRR